MPTRLHLTLIVGLAVIVWASVLWLRGTGITEDHFYPFGIAVSAVWAGCTLFDLWVWRSPVFRGWLVRRPRIDGTWSVVLQSSWVNPETGVRIGPIDAFMVIRQTYSSLSLRLFTAESKSRTLLAQVQPSEDSVFRVVAFYQNDPLQELRGVRSEIHYGALCIDIASDPVVAMEGAYWTDRSTRGEMKFSFLSRKFAHSFSEGKALA